MSVETDTQAHSHNGHGQSSLGTAAARNLATTTKTPPQMQGITNRWVQKVLPWLDVKGGTYRVNRRVSYSVGDGRVEVLQTGDRVSIIAAELGEFPALRGYDDDDVLSALAGRFAQLQIEAGTVGAQKGTPISSVLVVVHGRLVRSVLRVHSRVADLFNEPMNQIEHQLKLTVAELRERQEHELINNPDFGLLHNVDYSQRLHPISGPPTP